MSPAAPLLLLLVWWLAKRNGGASSPAAAQPAYTYPPVTPTPAVAIPVSVPSGPTFSKQWLVYKPLNEAVISRAQQLLKDPSAKTETIERDPSGGTVRYLKLNAPPGKVSVTAWRPNPNYQAPGGIVPA